MRRQGRSITLATGTGQKPEQWADAGSNCSGPWCRKSWYSYILLFGCQSHLVNCSLPKPKRFPFSSTIQKIAIFKEIKICNNEEVWNTVSMLTYFKIFESYHSLKNKNQKKANREVYIKTDITTVRGQWIAEMYKVNWLKHKIRGEVKQKWFPFHYSYFRKN